MEIIFNILFYRISVKTGKESTSEPVKDNIVMRVNRTQERPIITVFLAFGAVISIYFLIII